MLRREPLRRRVLAFPPLGAPHPLLAFPALREAIARPGAAWARSAFSDERENGPVPQRLELSDSWVGVAQLLSLRLSV